jgi:hypothetical protein
MPIMQPAEPTACLVEGMKGRPSHARVLAAKTETPTNAKTSDKEELTNKCGFGNRFKSGRFQRR